MSVDARHFQVMAAHRDSRTFYNARLGVIYNNQVGAWTKRWSHRDGRGPCMRQNNAPRIDVPFFRCTRDFCYIVCIAESVTRCVDIFSSNFP